MIGACALAGVVVLANLYTWGRVLAALLLPQRARLARALLRDAPTLALRPEVQALTHMVSALLYHHHHHHHHHHHYHRDDRRVRAGRRGGAGQPVHVGAVRFYIIIIITIIITIIVMIGACALAGVVVLANLYTWGRVLAALLLPQRARLARALLRDAPTLALRPEVQALTHMRMKIRITMEKRLMHHISKKCERLNRIQEKDIAVKPPYNFFYKTSMNENENFKVLNLNYTEF
ncbi:hypothetical protein ACJJTC_004374 [Scirpophaga incertulas]